MRERPDRRATGRVVAILEPTPKRSRIVGILQTESNPSVTFVPADQRLPKFHTRLNDLPADLRSDLKVQLIPLYKAGYYAFASAPLPRTDS